MEDMDPTTQGQVRALISEFRRLASYEKETRRKSNQLPIPEVIRKWEASVENLKRAVYQVNEFYRRVLEQRAICEWVTRGGQISRWHSGAEACLVFGTSSLVVSDLPLLGGLCCPS